MSIKLICIDMDGTLLMDQHNISTEDKEAIKYAVNKGVHVAITTGRVYNCAKLYSNLIGLTTPIIASNGAFIGGISGEEIYKNPLNIDDAKLFLEITRKYNLFSYLTANFGIVSMEELSENNIYKVLNKSLKDEEKIKLEVMDNIDDIYRLYNGEILKGVCIEKTNTDTLLKAKKELQEKCPHLEIVSSWNDNFEVMKKGSSKGEAVAYLSNYLGLDRNEVMCIGDSENDLSMIKFAGTGVAMKNAIDTVKDAATFITDYNTNSGVAKAILKFV